ncbi:MAG TPA: DUF488 family protein [Tepidisphaeraceae bacterium]|jgi:uncharacterized protein YeaO (DUF488 family)|nr:DUF488 family protein [Tepidisphaeraceae bacterium]
MIKVKHFLDEVESDDGQRLWVEPIGLTKDLCEWCEVSHVLAHLGPPVRLWNWYEQHPDGYDNFRAEYHEFLKNGPYHEALQELARIAQRETFTLLHQCDDALHNSAMALYEYLCELQAYCPPE